ncbi:hydantoinase B/oxoprolinase family protein [Luteolibacter luteus]|uniref:5-oxoprolinase n=1 Tax=Luteolibacter luteus TaxID=2728835 RepID=A0A858RFA1_9BACT|nr:hydantoinase B/oxoprolinase family protein [Luteolibacter luteus]QJE95412.1 5-oxoprolinase [Luteolibacter luteus]
MHSPWRIRVDTGGTFTDAWAIGPDGVERRAKILSDGTLRCRLLAREGEWWTTDSALVAMDDTFAGWSAGGAEVFASREGARLLKLTGNTANLVVGGILELSCGDEAPVAVARILTGTPAARTLPPVDFRVATTRGTNALLERKGAPVFFVVSSGFADLLEIRDQRRELLLSLDQPHRPGLASLVCSCGGMLDSAGKEIEPLETSTLLEVARQGRQNSGVRTAAVALMHSWVNPEHERRVGEILREAGFENVCLSSEVAPMIRLLPRAETAVADAYLAPIMEHFIRRISGAMEEGEPWLMTSAGGLVPASRFRSKDSLLSGPAGGLVGAAELARAAGFPKVLTFDMGGTSTDVSRIDGPFTWRQEQEIGPARVFAPALRIETVAAGGGSICQWRNGRLEVGPESAGADPGPACYGRGGPLTLTDVNLLLGLMDPDKAGIPLARVAAERRLEELLKELWDAGETEATATSLLAGLRDIAVETMAEAIRGVSVREGNDPGDFALLAFGGAGPQHACAVAEKLGVRSVLVPADAGLLSAWGLERARRQEQRGRQMLLPFGAVEKDLPAIWTALAADAAASLHEPDFRWLADLRLAGQDTYLTVEVMDHDDVAPLLSRFAEEYQKLYGYPLPAGKTVELVALRVVAEEKIAACEPEDFGSSGQAGPLLLQDRFSTCFIPEGWTLRRGSRGTLLLEQASKTAGVGSGVPAAVRAGLFRSRFEGIVTAMGEMLRRTALSTNVKERLDFSCALLDAEGYLVASAPHVPVHLGALGVCVREVLKVIDPGPGDVVISNHPAFGGSHLPDVTLIAPVFDGAGKRIAFVANRAHHAEIGGKAPGSMPADARVLAEEGVVIAPRLLVRAGMPLLGEIEELLRDGPWPSRRIGDNLADLEAQLASTRHGVVAIERLAAEHGGAMVRNELRGILARSSALMNVRLRGLALDKTVTSSFDDGTPLVIRLVAEGGRLHLDFAGTGPVHPRNLNATPAIVRSAVLFVLRLWLGEDVPLNEGLLEEVEISIPTGLLSPDFGVDPSRAPAVVGGNVETSQRITDLLLEALDLAANGPGTMNNFLFGDQGFGYYETIAGGSGAGPRHSGTSGRHVHMTNTAITDPEVMEYRFPVRLHRYEVRRTSGGEGCHRGGDGVVREVEFLKPLVVSFLTERRVLGPRGMHGGSDGLPGRQTRIHPDGSQEELPGAITYAAQAGERVLIETPGGGGWGTPQ